LRPKRVYHEELPKYTIFHTRKVKMISGVELTALHLMKETEKMYISFDSWSSFCDKIKMKKKNFQLQFDIPLTNDANALKMLDRHSWKDVVEKEKDYSDMFETLELLNKLFPNEKKVFFYELTSLVSAFVWGTFEENINHPSKIKSRDYYRQKYYNEFETKTLREISKNSVICPYAYSKSTSTLGREYEHAGTICFVKTPETIYFDIERSY